MDIARERLEGGEDPVPLDPLAEGAPVRALAGPEFREIEARHDGVLRHAVRAHGRQRRFHLLGLPARLGGIALGGGQQRAAPMQQRREGGW
jgi:hypothetical protein